MVAIEIVHRFGLEFLARWAHVLAGITWIGLLYYFNFVQVPAFAQMEGPARNNAIDKLASRALWWFRWAAAATFGFGILLLALMPGAGDSSLTSSSFWKSSEGVAIATGILLGVTMLANVWGVIWRNQKLVIANARNVQAGGEADPAAAAAGRTAFLASRMNTVFSLPMLFFMIGAAHFFTSDLYDTSSNRGGYWAVTGILWLVLELNCLGVIGGKAVGNITNWIYESHLRALAAGAVLTVVWYALWELFF